jgi:hypothetical protein
VELVKEFGQVSVKFEKLFVKFRRFLFLLVKKFGQVKKQKSLFLVVKSLVVKSLVVKSLVVK